MQSWMNRASLGLADLLGSHLPECCAEWRLCLTWRIKTSGVPRLVAQAQALDSTS